jgi:hypothetical protein
LQSIGLIWLYLFCHRYCLLLLPVVEPSSSC